MLRKKSSRPRDKRKLRLEKRMHSSDDRNNDSHEASPNSRSLKTILRRISYFAIVGGAIGSVVLLLMSRENAPIFLVALFAIWVLAPFALFAIASRFDRRWHSATRNALYSITTIITLASLAAYSYVNIWPPQSTRAFVWVLAPPLSVLLTIAVVGITALISRRSSK